MKADLHTHRAVTQHVLPKPYVTAAYAWKCGTCPTTTPDEVGMINATCPNCGGVMFYTPVKKDYHGGK